MQIFCAKAVSAEGPVEKGDNVFNDPKRSKINKDFLSTKITRLNFNSTQFQQLNFSIDNLLDN